jgi:hypothetical protein
MVRAGSVVCGRCGKFCFREMKCVAGEIGGVALHDGRTEDFLCGRGRNELRMRKLNLI